MEMFPLDPTVIDGENHTSQNSVLREAMENLKKEVALIGDICLDDSDPAFPMLWCKGAGPKGENYLVCWQASNPSAESMKDMVEDWSHFIVLDNNGTPQGSARDFFLTK